MRNRHYNRIIHLGQFLYNWLWEDCWNLAFIFNDLEEVVTGGELHFKAVKNPYKDRWFADPFILSYDNNNVYLLVEEYRYIDHKGRISKLTVNKESLEIDDVITLIEEDTHLSFPAIMRKEGMIFVYPENSQANGLWLYEYDSQTETCKKIDKLSGLPLTDAIITERLGEKMVFSTREPIPNNNVLEVFEWNSMERSYKSSQIIEFKENLARNAGDFFVFENNIYRPAQECNTIYGHAISIQKLLYVNGIVEFEEIRRITVPSIKWGIGIHTFNTLDEMIVTDFRKFRNVYFGYFALMMKKLVLSIKRNIR